MSPDMINSNVNTNSPGDGGNYIVHHVSKMDTLAGIAIKYGVEVADIRKLNNLVTDIQIFALKTLLIPRLGRHPPSPCLSDSPADLSNGSACPGENSYTKSAQHGGWSNVLESFQTASTKATGKKVSPAMNSLQNYYGLKSPYNIRASEGIGTPAYTTSSSHSVSNGIPLKSPLIADLLSKFQLESQKATDDSVCESSGTGQHVPLVDSGNVEIEMSNMKYVRRRQKAEADPKAGSSETLLTVGNNVGNSRLSPLTGKRLAMRKAASRTELSADSESGCLNSIPVGLGDSVVTDGLTGVRKSSSASSLLDQGNSNSTSIWPTSGWSLKPDLQALSAAALSRPIFDGLPKPITSRRKTALD